VKSFVHSPQRRPAVAVTSATAAGATPPGRTTAALGLELAAALHGVIGGGRVGLIADPAAVTVDVRWEAPATLTLVVRVRGEANVARVVGELGGAAKALRSLFRRKAARHGLRCAVEVEAVEA